jgi:aromatic ring-cleaving dioxygenase
MLFTGEGTQNLSSPSKDRSPHELSEIASFHAHVYYDPDSRAEAEQLRVWIGERFRVTLGRWHDSRVGPHDRAMFQVAFANDVFPALVPWLMLNHGSLSVLVHPNTVNPRRDHTDNSVWIGQPLVVHAEALPDEGVAELPMSPNTIPSRSA